MTESGTAAARAGDRADPAAEVGGYSCASSFTAVP